MKLHCSQPLADKEPGYSCFRTHKLYSRLKHKHAYCLSSIQILPKKLYSGKNVCVYIIMYIYHTASGVKIRWLVTSVHI